MNHPQARTQPLPQHNLCQPPSPQHIFSLTKINIDPLYAAQSKDAYLNGQPIVEFSLETHPIFNNDGEYYTPAFILEEDEPRWSHHLPYHLKMHNQMCLEQLHQRKTKIYVPKPSPKNNYCCICATVFTDYLTHLSLPSHIELMRNSPANGNIEELCQQYQQQAAELSPPKRKRGRPCKTKPISKLHSSTSLKQTCSEQSVKAELAPSLFA